MRGTPEYEAELPPDNSEWTTLLEDETHLGPSFFSSTTFENILSQKFGATMGVTLFPPEPNASALIFKGEFGVTSGVGVRIDGDVAMLGTWNGALARLIPHW